MTSNTDGVLSLFPQAGKSRAFCRPRTKGKSAKAPQANFAD